MAIPLADVPNSFTVPLTLLQAKTSSVNQALDWTQRGGGILVDCASAGGSQLTVLLSSVFLFCRVYTEIEARNNDKESSSGCSGYIYE